MTDDQEQSVLALVQSVTKVEATLEHISNDVTEMRADVKDLREGAPLHRIESLEARWKAALAWLGSLSIVVIGAIVTALITR